MKKTLLVGLLSLLSIAALAAPAKGRKAARSAAPAAAPAPGLPETAFRRTPYVGAIAVDAQTGHVLFEDHADTVARPASVTKLMTLLLCLEDMHALKYDPTTRVTASVRCSQEKPSSVGLKPGQSMTVDDLLMSIMVKSANDAAVLLAENSTARNAGREIRPGDLQAFIVRMNAKARQLGMLHTHYETPNGYPPKPGSKRPFDTSTARDLVKLAQAVLRYPEVFRFTKTKLTTVTDGAGNPLRMVNHNNILVKDKMKILDELGESEVDGLKTGYIDAGGSSIILTGKRNGKRAIVIVLGSQTSKLRDQHARQLMVDALDKIQK
ncbi:MAG: D-alanyl-D-alanine carboxypeptidase [Kiritimatiellae bacterium]|nr:D-alanyl-D-alanine carboxypeptidase [Kiritimatiellia bacterium]